jgi:2-methylcitrate dehydratase
MSAGTGANTHSIRSLAEWTLATEPVYRSPIVLRQARLLLLDTLGCAIIGARAPTAQRVRVLVDALGGNPECTLIGAGGRTSVLNAAFANGVAVRNLDLNDVMFIQKEGRLSVGGHCSDTIPAALAVAERAGSTCEEVLQSIVVGYQLFGRLRDVMPFASVWDGASSCGLVAAAMAGRLMRLTLEAQAHALSLAAIRCATPKVVRWGSLSSAKNVASSLIACAGIEGALLASHGLTGPPEVLDHPGGMGAVFDKTLGLEQLWAAPPAVPQIMAANVKTYACIGTAQTLAAAALDMHGRLKAPLGEIAAIDVVMADLPMIRNQQAEPDRQVPQTREDADHSFTYIPVAALRDGELGERQFENERWLDPEARELIAKVGLATSAELRDKAPGSMPCRLVVRLQSGTEIAIECLYPPGHSFPDKGLDESVVTAKFRAVTAYALSAENSARIIDWTMTAKSTAPVRDLFALLT